VNPLNDETLRIYQVIDPEGHTAPLHIHEVMREIAANRVSGRASLGEREFFAKIFLGKNAHSRFSREVEGSRAVAATDLATPALLQTIRLENGGACCLFEFIPNFLTLKNALASNPRKALMAMAHALGQFHAGGLVHGDLHLENFGWYKDAILVCDCGSISACATDSRETFVQFLSQWDPALDGLIGEAVEAHQAAGGVLTVDAQVLARVDLPRARQRRLDRFDKKMLRDNRRLDGRQKHSLVTRDLAPELTTYLQAILEKDALKDGDRIEWKERTLECQVFRRKTHARTIWTLSHRLQLFDVKAARPVAMVLSPLPGGKSFVFHETCDTDNSFNLEALAAALLRWQLWGLDGLLENGEPAGWKDGVPIVRPSIHTAGGPALAPVLAPSRDMKAAVKIHGNALQELLQCNPPRP